MVLLFILLLCAMFKKALFNKKVLTILILTMFFPLTTYAKDYEITNYDIKVIVNENNTYQITETIKANFFIPKHGIIRCIPLVNNVVRSDGSSYTNKAKIKNIKVNQKYKTYNEKNNKVIKIGTNNKTYTGLKEYVISYLYDIGDDKTNKYDEVYLNLIGNNWDTNINNISFSVTMPKDFDTSKISFTSGKYGVINSYDVNYEVDGKVITGVHSTGLSSNEALTIRIELPDGYFLHNAFSLDLKCVMLFLPIIFLIIGIILWQRFGTDDKVIETIEFYPPKNLNSLETGFYYKGYVDDADVLSLLIYLANKGYIEITEENSSNFLFNKYDFNIKLLKKYDGTNFCEKLFLHGLFKNGKSKVTGKELSKSFYMTVDSIKSYFNNRFGKDTPIYYEKNSLRIQKYFYFMITIIVVLINASVICKYGAVAGTRIVSGFFLISLFISLFEVLYSFAIIKSIVDFILGKRKPKLIDIIKFLFATCVGGLLLYLLYSKFLFKIINYDKFYFLTYIIGLFCYNILCLLCLFSKKRTSKVNKLFGKIIGFKNYLAIAEKDNIRSLIKENPNYFYDVYAYAYALGIENDLIKKFTNVVLRAPFWYKNSNNFDTYSLNRFMNKKMKSTYININSYASKVGSSSSRHSGNVRGSSGGGSGGGGGSSW